MKAFPIGKDCSHIDKLQGMDLRDYFAAKAMQALISRPSALVHREDFDNMLAEKAYEIADEMMDWRDQ